MSQSKANLDAWQVLQTVIDAGGFAQAARQLKRSQSAISYSISKLQEQIGLELLTIQGRRAVLTEHGALLLERSRALLASYNDILELADELQKGHEPNLTLWIDGHCPTWFLKPVLGEFQTHFPRTALTLLQGGETGFGDRQDTQIDLAITTQPIWDTGFSNLGKISFIAVVHPNHPLLGCDAPLSHSQLEAYRQVKLYPASLGKTVPSRLVPDRSIWLVSSLHQAREAVLIGQAYAWLPQELIEAELAQGKLKRLELEHGESYQLPVYLQFSDSDHHSNNRPATQAMAKLITRYFSLSR